MLGYHLAFHVYEARFLKNYWECCLRGSENDFWYFEESDGDSGVYALVHWRLEFCVFVQWDVVVIFKFGKWGVTKVGCLESFWLSCEGLRVYLGKKNKLSSVNYAGGDAGGGNATVTYTFTTFNDFTVMHQYDIAGKTTDWWGDRSTYLAPA